MSARILVGVDASAPARAAALWAADRAAATGSRLELVHVMDDEVAVGSAARAGARASLGALVMLARSVAPDVSIGSWVVNGIPFEVLVEESRTADIVVIGTHRTGFIYGRSFGSVFVPLAWRASCDVAVIPDLVDRGRRGVVVALDVTSMGLAALRFAADEAVRMAQELIVVSPGSSVGIGDSPPGSAAARAAQLARAVTAARSGRPTLTVRTRSTVLPAAEALVETSAAATVLVIGRRSPDRSRGALRSSNRDVLVNLSSPVIIVRGEPKPPPGAEPVDSVPVNVLT